MELDFYDLVAYFFRSVAAGALTGAAYSVTEIIEILLGRISINTIRIKALRRAFCAVLSKIKFLKGNRAGADISEEINENAGKSKFLRAVLDVLFCMFAAVCAMLVMYHGNKGVFRWFVIPGAILGFCAFFLTLGRLLKLFVTEIACFLKLVALTAFLLVAFPLTAVVRITARVLSSCAQRKRYRYSRKKYRKLIYSAQKGFLLKVLSDKK